MSATAVAERIRRAREAGENVILASPERDRSESDFARSVVEGLDSTPRYLDCAFLYDARGSELFERITEQPEYYLTRTEAGILADNADAIAARTGAVRLVELGSGYSVKTRHILDAYLRCFNDSHYVPIDVSPAALEAARASIESAHPDVIFSGIIGSYESALPVLPSLSPCMVIFLGSTFGNLDERQSEAFLEDLAASLNGDDYVLLGLDLHKDTATIEAAYNDEAGVTHEFIVNILARMNRELGSAIDLQAVRHVSDYNLDRKCVETGVVFDRAQSIRVVPCGRTFEVAAGERISIEISRKFELDEFRPQLEQAGFEIIDVFKDAGDQFGLLLLRPRGSD